MKSVEVYFGVKDLIAFHSINSNLGLTLSDPSFVWNSNVIAYRAPVWTPLQGFGKWPSPVF